MNENLLSALKSFITPEFIEKASSTLGESTEKSSVGFISAMPALLTGLISKGTTLEGAKSLINLIREDDYESGVPSNYLNNLKGGKTTELFLRKGQDALKGIFGENLNSITDNLASTTGLKRSSSNNLLALLAPLAMGVLGSKIKSDNLNASSLVSFFNEQRARLLGSNLGGMSEVEKGVRPVVDRPFEGGSEYRPPDSAHKDSKKSWLPLGVAAALLLGGLYLVRDWNPGVHQQAGTAVSNPTEPAVPQSPAIVEKIATFLEGTSDDQLPQRFPLEHLTFTSGTLQMNSEAIQTVDGIADLLKKYPNTLIKIEGFADNRGTVEINETLSQKRADAVKLALIARGVGADRMSTAGMGAANPVASNDTEEGRQANRRAELIILQR